MIGESVSHFMILEKLGEGGMGIVYKARDTRLERVVALKSLPQHLTDNPAEKRRFTREARTAATLSHQNVAVIYEIGEFNEQMFIAILVLQNRWRSGQG
jgi:serine/threonine protein kinase